MFTDKQTDEICFGIFTNFYMSPFKLPSGVVVVEDSDISFAVCFFMAQNHLE